MTSRLSGLVLLLASGCVFTPRPMIPITPDGGEFLGGSADAGRANYDSATGAVTADGGTSWSGDAPAADLPPGPLDSTQCRRAGDAGDSGFVDEAGQPCDPDAEGDGGVRDASCDAAADAAADAPDSSCDGAVSAGIARAQR